MLYVNEELDRSTGELRTVSLGHYITVSELGDSYGVGRQKVRAILHHMGLLRKEGWKYRLAPFAVEAGLGKRINKSRSGYAFDVISPEGQRLIAAEWHETVASLEREVAQDDEVCTARKALTEFAAGRREKLETRQEVCWLHDHFGSLTCRQIASIVSATEQLVGRYVTQSDERKAFHTREVERELPRLSAEERFQRFAESATGRSD